MSGRIFVVIFFFWAVLTIITPTLVHLSETAKSQQQSNGETSDGEIKARRMMMGYAEKKHQMKTTKVPTNSTQTPAPAPAPARAPAPAPETPMKRKAKAYLGRVFSESVRSMVNKTRLNVV